MGRAGEGKTACLTVKIGVGRLILLHLVFMVPKSYRSKIWIALLTMTPLICLNRRVEVPKFEVEAPMVNSEGTLAVMWYTRSVRALPGWICNSGKTSECLM